MTIRDDTAEAAPPVPEPFCPWDPTLTLEEAERIVREPEEYSLDEILQELERP